MIFSALLETGTGGVNAINERVACLEARGEDRLVAPRAASDRVGRCWSVCMFRRRPRSASSR